MKNLTLPLVNYLLLKIESLASKKNATYKKTRLA